jgi:hypothetical protein
MAVVAGSNRRLWRWWRRKRTGTCSSSGQDFHFGRLCEELTLTRRPTAEWANLNRDSRDLLDHVIPINEKHLRRLMSATLYENIGLTSIRKTEAEIVSAQATTFSPTA